MRSNASWRWMTAILVASILVVGAAQLAEVAPASELNSAGNTDGVLTWQLGSLEPNQTAREVVLFVYADSWEAVTERLGVLRSRFQGQARVPASADQVARSAAASPSGGSADSAAAQEQAVWIDNGLTDFALQGPAFFRWDWTKRQSLRSARGGQLSQFTWYVHYRDGRGVQRAGVPHFDRQQPENVRIVEPVRQLSPTEAVGVVESADGQVRIRVRAALGDGPGVAVEFLVTNLTADQLADVRLSTYANIESAHDETNDFSFLDRRTGGVLVYDPPTATCVAMAGLRPPATGHSGVWNSFGHLQNGTGVALDRWPEFRGPTQEVAQRFQIECAAAQGIYLPVPVENPVTPPTRDLTAAEAGDALRRDWLFQAMGQPLAARAKAEIGWARSLAQRLARTPRPPDVAAELAELDRLEHRLAALSAQAGPADQTADADPARELYFAVRQVKRAIAFRNPVLDFNQLLFIDQPYPHGKVNDTHQSIHRMGVTATPGGRLLVLEGLHPGGRLRQLAPDRPGSFWRPDLSFDGGRVLYCYKAHDEKSFHLFEMNLDGTGRRQLTDSEYDDIDPIYLPDGHIMFTTTRGNSYVRCGPFIYSYILARCDADGGNVYLVSYNGEPDYVPSLMNDGRVIYSRWEYSDKPLWRVQSLWTTNQDGTHTSVFWGNQSVWPDHLSEPRPIPGSHRIMFSGVGHHDWWSGSIGIIDPIQGFNFPHGLTKVTADRPWPECSVPPLDTPESSHYHAAGNYTGYKTAYPLSERDFLVSARGDDGKFRLYLMDVDGNRDLIHEGAHNVWHAMPVKPRVAPPRQVDRVAWPGTGAQRKPAELGTFYNADVYEGVPELQRGSVKYLRVFQLDHKTYSTWAKTYRHSGPAVSIVQEEGVKRVLSIVPVEPDGSVYFQVPPGRSIFFQLLDEQYRCLHTMRSFTGVLPGERRSCTGCHEIQRGAVDSRPGLALSRLPTELSPPPWGTESVSYERFAQPLLDRYCGKCHQGDGEARKVLDLTLRPGHNVFQEPYLTLVGSAGWYNPIPNRGQAGYGIAGVIPVESVDPTMNDPAAYGTLRPMRYLSSASRLVELASSGKHYGVKADPLSLHRLITWVDACAPYMGEEELRAQGDPDFAGIDLLPIRPRVRTAPVVERP